jgi:hypothetical protein
MDTERESNPGPSDRAWTQATPSPRPAGDPSSTEQAGTVGQAIGTRMEAGGKSATELREGDAVTVTYTNRDGKIVAQTVELNAP